MSMKRDHENGPIKGFSCEAEDLSVAVKKRVKRAPQKIITHGQGSRRAEDDAFRKVQDNKLLTVTITEIMDIREPISKLRSLLETRLGIDLNTFIICLQDNIELEPDMSLGEQCIQSHGVAEIKVELKQQNGIKCINILDVLRLPQDDDDSSSLEEDLSTKANGMDMAADDKSDSSSESRNSPTPFSWNILQDFNSLFEIDFPGAEIESWDQIHIQHWLKWAMKEFNIEFIDDSMWIMNGKQLSKMTIDQFHSKVPVDPFNMLWTHIELLRKCQIFAIVEKVGERSGTSLTRVPKPPRIPVRKPRTPTSPISALPGNGKRSSLTGHNGQIQLWQFLLELLGDRNSKNVIQWVGRDGEFKLIDPELVAQMWGQRKNKPKMNYEKLSRALRYYYSEAMIAKVHGRRFVYKFVCNLKELVGYSTQELIDLVEDDPVVITTVS